MNVKTQMALLLALILTGCASNQDLSVQCQALPEVPAAVMTKRVPDFKTKMQKILFENPQGQTK